MRDQDLFLERALLESDRLTSEQVKAVRARAMADGTDLVDGLIRSELISSHEVAMLKANICEAPFVELSDFEPCHANTSLIPRSVAERHRIFPLFMINGVLTLAMDDPLHIEAADQARQLAKCEVDAVLCDRQHLDALIARAYSLSHVRSEGGEAIPEVDSSEVDRSQPVVAAVNQMISDAVDERASDVHLSPDEHELRVRYRVDGVLHEKQGPALAMHGSIVQRLKVMANLDLTQTRRPQDGKFRFRHHAGVVDVRLSSVPTVNGENVVMRLLTRTEATGDFVELGVPKRIASDLDDILANPYGMLLVTGPTGSGKTTTLYTALSKLNDPSRNIMTVEDPVEIRMPYVRQIQVHSEIGMTFANALRAILRQDPDVILVGEIRDEDTARIAVQSALTGHMVLSTVHTNDAVGAVARLRDYGLEPFVINSAMLGIVAQRLVRRVCSHCATEAQPTALQRERFAIGAGNNQFRRGTGCRHCGQTGYHGRIGIYELFRFNNTVQRLIEEGGSTDQLRRLMQQYGHALMWEDGLEKARLGLTTLDEVTRAATIADLDDDTRSLGVDDSVRRLSA